jgi:hypothetical protein
MASSIRSSHKTLVSLALSTTLCACSSTTEIVDSGTQPTDGSPHTDDGKAPKKDGSTKDAHASTKDSADDTAASKEAGSSDASSGAGDGPGAKLLCTSSGKNAWETYGAAGFVAVNKAIFANVVAGGADAGAGDAGGGFGPSFGAVGSGTVAALDDPLATFEGKLAAFLVYAYGGPNSIQYTDGKTYSGLQDMVAAHKGLDITPSQYSYFIANAVVPALTSSGVKTEDVSSCFAPLVLSTTFMQQIVGNGASAGSDLRCTSGKNAFDTYGAAAFVKVNESIFAAVASQEATDAGISGLGTTFQAVGTGRLDDASVPALDDSAATFKGKLAAFLVWSFGGPTEITYTDGKTYSGILALTSAHSGLGISADQYTYFVTNVVVPALTTNGVSEADVTACFAPVISDPAFEAQVVGL